MYASDVCERAVSTGVTDEPLYCLQLVSQSPLDGRRRHVGLALLYIILLFPTFIYLFSNLAVVSTLIKS
jgi:hypothetical protein